MREGSLVGLSSKDSDSALKLVPWFLHSKLPHCPFHNCWAEVDMVVGIALYTSTFQTRSKLDVDMRAQL